MDRERPIKSALPGGFKACVFSIESAGVTPKGKHICR